MTNGQNNNSDRLDRIERILESVAQRTDSNARTIQGILDARATDRLRQEEEKAEQVRRMARLEDLMARLVGEDTGAEVASAP